MKIPEPAPDWQKTIQSISSEDIVVKNEALSNVIEKANNEYTPWEKFKYKVMPKGISPEEAWAILQFHRSSSRQNIPLTNKHSKLFSYRLSQEIYHKLSLIDNRNSMDSFMSGSYELYKEQYKKHGMMGEAIASSQLEGAKTKTKIAREMLRSNRKPSDVHEQMIRNNYETISMLESSTYHPLSHEFLCEIQTMITEETLEDPSWANRYRNSMDKDIVVEYQAKTLYTPPPFDQIPELMSRLFRFLESSIAQNEHPAIVAIILHFWVAYVHPFRDGNGRVARALFYWYMVKHDFDLFRCLNITSVIKQAPIQYYKSLLYSETEDCDLTYFIMYHLRIIGKAIKDFDAFIIEESRRTVENGFLKSLPYMLNHRQKQILSELLSDSGSTYTIEKHMNTHGTARQTARTDLLELHELGLLDMRKEGRKFVFTPVADLAEKLKQE